MARTCGQKDCRQASVVPKNGARLGTLGLAALHQGSSTPAEMKVIPIAATIARRLLIGTLQV
ncbi:hypothetical protein SMJ63A_100101 [Stenotrophomonas geniculata]